MYYIIETANTHAGSKEYLSALIREFEEFTDNFGIKFQAFHPDYISTKNYEYYNVYQGLYFEKKEWKYFLELAHQTKDVWLDIFDVYGVEVLLENINIIHGLKFQTSVLQNLEVFSLLKGLDLSGKKIIINIAAREIDEIKKIVQYIQDKLKPKELLLEFGFQAYPTQLQDSGLSKIELIKKHFSNKIVFADHVDGKSDDAIWLPVVAAMQGINYIEKHVMLSDRETTYDHYSSIEHDRFKLMVSNIEKYVSVQKNEFINEREKIYLNNTIMVPILRNFMEQGRGISIEKDLMFRRTGKIGLNLSQINELLSTFHILRNDKAAQEPLNAIDFKKSNIATIIACRLKSLRLPSKALLPIGNKPSVEYCISNALKFYNVNFTILATSDLPQDEELKNHTYHSSVIFFKGDAEDVIRRYLAVADLYKIDVIIRVTADNPFIDNEICQLLLREHFSTGADYTTAKSAALGTNLEIINVQALKRVKNYFPYAEYSEYMTWYFQNNPDHFHIHFVELPDELVREYRLTLDYQEDLELFNQIDNYFTSQNITNFSLKDILKFLDENPSISKLNNNLAVRYKTDPMLIKTLNEKTRMK